MQYTQRASDSSFEILAGDAFNYLAGLSQALEMIWEQRPKELKKYLLISSEEMSGAIVLLVNSFGMASTILFDNSPKRSSENAAVYRVRCERVKKFASFFSGIDTSIFLDRRIRNRHIHSDEYLAKLILHNPDASTIKDVALSHREMISSEVGELIYIRVYVFEEDVLLHLGAEFDVKKLYETSLLMSERMRA